MPSASTEPDPLLAGESLPKGFYSLALPKHPYISVGRAQPCAIPASSTRMSDHLFPEANVGLCAEPRSKASSQAWIVPSNMGKGNPQDCPELAAGTQWVQHSPGLVQPWHMPAPAHGCCPGSQEHHHQPGALLSSRKSRLRPRGLCGSASEGTDGITACATLSHPPWSLSQAQVSRDLTQSNSMSPSSARPGSRAGGTGALGTHTPHTQGQASPQLGQRSRGITVNGSSNSPETFQVLELLLHEKGGAKRSPS